MQKIYTVYDEKAGAFLPPFFVSAEGLALRAFKDCVNAPEHQFGKHPADYTLFRMGEWDDVTGDFQLTDRKSLGNGVEFREITLPDNLELPLNEPPPLDRDK